MPLLLSQPLAAAPRLPSWSAAAPSSSSTLKTFVVLRSARSASSLPTKASPSSSSSSRRLSRRSSVSSSSCSTMGSDDELEAEEDVRAVRVDDAAQWDAALSAAAAYTSFAAVTAKKSGSQLRWCDLDRAAAAPCSATLARLLATITIPKRAAAARSAPSPAALALELCFGFLDQRDVQAAAAACRAFRDVIATSDVLLPELYARRWRADAAAPLGHRPLPTAYGSRPYRSLLLLGHRAAAAGKPYPLSTRCTVSAGPDGTIRIANRSMLRSFAAGAVDSVRGTQPLPWLACGLALGRRVAYYEVTLERGGGSVGVAGVDSTAYGFGSAAHVGWAGVSYGYHGNAGDFVSNDGSAAFGGAWEPFGPAWGVDGAADGESRRCTVGCGLDADSDTLFFTVDGRFVGRAPGKVRPGQYAAAVSLHSLGDAALLNMGSAGFLYDVEGYCASP